MTVAREFRFGSEIVHCKEKNNQKRGGIKASDIGLLFHKETNDRQTKDNYRNHNQMLKSSPFIPLLVQFNGYSKCVLTNSNQ